MSLYVLDVESDGPIPGTDCYSMLSFALVKIGDHDMYLAEKCIKPISKKWDAEALAISGQPRSYYEMYGRDPKLCMENVLTYVNSTNSNGRPTILSDNPAYDWSFFNWYLHYFTRQNPFGYSARRIGDFYSGLKKDFYSAKWKHLRKTKHTHNPLDDAKGNAEAFETMCKDYGVRL